MKRLILILTLVTVAACGPKLTPETPKAAAAIKADAVMIRVNEVQAAVIDYCGPAPTCAPGTIDTNTAREVVAAMSDLRKTLRQVPAGWQATVKAGWMAAKGRLAGVSNPAIVAALAGVDALLGAL